MCVYHSMAIRREEIHGNTNNPGPTAGLGIIVAD